MGYTKNKIGDFYIQHPQHIVISLENRSRSRRIAKSFSRREHLIVFDFIRKVLLSNKNFATPLDPLEKHNSTHKIKSYLFKISLPCQDITN